MLDCPDARGRAEFCRVLLGLRHRPGDEPPEPGVPGPPGGAGWCSGTPPPRRLAFQELDRQHEWAPRLGARLLDDRRDDPQEPLRVYAGPAGHPFCRGAVIRAVASASRPDLAVREPGPRPDRTARSVKGRRPPAHAAQ